MEINHILEDNLNESFSKREVSFSDTSSLLYYTVGDTVDNLNNSAVHLINDSDFPLSQEKIAAHAKSISSQYMLPEVKVILERLPDDLLHSYSKNIGAYPPKPIAKSIENADKSWSLRKRNVKSVIKQTNLPSNKNCSSLDLSNSRLAKKIHGSNANEIVSETTSVAIRPTKKSNRKISKSKKKAVHAKTKSSNFSKRLIDHNPNSVQNSLLESLSSTEIKTSDEFILKKYIASQSDHPSLSFDKYPCVHLENLNLGPYLESSSSNFENFQNEIDPEIKVVAEANIYSPFNCGKHTLNEENYSRNVNLCSKASFKDDPGATDNISSELCILLEKLNLPTTETDSKLANSSESKCVSSVPAADDASHASSFDLPVQIKNVCSISKKKFRKTQKYNLMNSYKNSTAAAGNAKSSIKKNISVQSDVACSSSNSNAGSNKIKKDRKLSQSVVSLVHLEKKRRKKSVKKNQKKLYKMIMKYLETEIKCKKHRNKSKKRKTKNSKSQKSSGTLDIESDDSVSLVYDSIKENKDLDHNDCAKTRKETSQHKTIQPVTMEKNTKVKAFKKNSDACLGFLSNKVSLRFYNKFFAAERLLLSKYKWKKDKKKELKKLFNRLKAQGFLKDK